MAVRSSCWLSVVALMVLAVGTSAEEFPHRQEYSSARPVSTEELGRLWEDGRVIIVDVRSEFEFEVIHPVNAIHVPLSSDEFVAELENLIRFNPGRQIVFYCNGVTCLKSYVATTRAVEAGLPDCFVYDAGIPAWANAFPERTLLLGELVSESGQAFRSKAQFKEKCLDFQAFMTQVKRPNSVLVDVREEMQKSGKLLGLEDAMPIPLTSFIDRFVRQKKSANKTLLVFDQVGKQVRWLEYYLLANGYDDYYFLSGGATAGLKKQKYRIAEGGK